MHEELKETLNTPPVNPRVMSQEIMSETNNSERRNGVKYELDNINDEIRNIEGWLFRQRVLSDSEKEGMRTYLHHIQNHVNRAKSLIELMELEV